MDMETRLRAALEKLLIDGGSVCMSSDTGLAVWSGDIAAREAAQMEAYALLFTNTTEQHDPLVETFPHLEAAQ